MTTGANQERTGQVSVRDPATGRFLKGNKTGGRPKGSGAGIPPFHVLVKRVAESQGVTTEDAMQAVTEQVLRQAVSGDRLSQKMVLDRIPQTEGESLVGEDGELLVDRTVTIDLGDGFPVRLSGALSLSDDELALLTDDYAERLKEAAGGLSEAHEDALRELDPKNPADRRALIFDIVAAVLEERREEAREVDEEIVEERAAELAEQRRADENSE